MINKIAEKIKKLRKEKDLTLKDLSKRTGLSISFLSQVENNSSSLAITSLKKISDALNVPITYFFNTLKPLDFVVKIKDQVPFKLEGSNSDFIKLSGNFSNRLLESIIIIIPPNQSHGHKFSHPGEEFIYVLDGSLNVNLDGSNFNLESGECIHFPATVEHILKNPLPKPTKVLTVVTPSIF